MATAMRFYFFVSCLGAAAAVLASAVWWVWPVILRLWRIPQVLVDGKDKDALRIGILGASFIARAAVVHAADKRRDVLVSAVAARDWTKAETFAKQHGIPAFHGGATAYLDLLAREDVDAVYVGLPTHLHLEWTLAALRAGKHVLLEKPAVLNMEEAKQLIGAMAETKLQVFEAAHHRYHPAARRFKQLTLKERDVGLSDFEARFSMLDPKALLSIFKELLGISKPVTQEDRFHERIKNLDRWYYCVDMLLWSTGAIDAEVIFAKEDRFSISATLKLQRSASTATATLYMARDNLWEPFSWSIAEHGLADKVRHA